MYNQVPTIQRLAPDYVVLTLIRTGNLYIISLLFPKATIAVPVAEDPKSLSF